MSTNFGLTKLVVHDIESLERFYVALGLKVVERRFGDMAVGEGDVAQEQSRLSETGDGTSYLLVLSRFPNFSPPPQLPYPGPVWLVFHVSDVEGIVTAAVSAGGSIVRPGEDRPEHGVRAAIVSDPEGHLVEVFGPIGGGR